MQGLYVNRAEGFPKKEDAYKAGLRLLARHPNLEIMQQNIFKGAVVWLVPSENEGDIEFFFVHSGKIEIECEGKTEVFRAGDSFYVNGIKNEMHFTTIEDTELIYVVSGEVFEQESDFQKELKTMISGINEKDNYTYKHSQHVMKYSMKLYMALKDLCKNVNTNDMLVAALFHDVGKIRIPDDVLNKKARLDPDEYELMKKHSIFGADILQPHYQKEIVEIALKHHERLDGSGYPFGIRAEEISFPVRILAVADAFDAMTTDRGYNRVKSFEDAASELHSLPEKYDQIVTEKLMELVRSGEIYEDVR